MPESRRRFLQSAALTMGAVGTFAAASQQTQAQPAGPGGLPEGPRQQADASAPPPAAARMPASALQVPTMRFGPVEISRLIVGCNPFYGFAHYNSILATIMREYYTSERVCDVLHQCSRFGINAYNYVEMGRAPEDLDRFLAEGGRMHLIVQGLPGPPAPFYAARKPLAMYYHGERTDRAFQNGQMATVREWCKQVRDLGCLVGVGTHKPEVIALVEEQGWDVDFYAGCVYNRTRTPEEWKKVLNGESLEMQGETYLRSDPPRMYRVMRQTRRPCFAFKILAAGRIDDRGAGEAFTQAFASLKPIDGVFVGMFPRVKDEVRENAERVCRILGSI